MRLETVWGSTMYDPIDLPFDGGVHGIPDTFTPFRNKVEKSCTIGLPLDGPDVDDNSRRLPKLPRYCHARDDGVDVGGARRASSEYMPTLADLGYTSEDIEMANSVDDRTAMPTNYTPCRG